MIKQLIQTICLLASCVVAQDAGSRSFHKEGQDNHVWVVAHRADYTFAPENSLAALENAIFFGADIIETDVRLTKDGKVVIIHDATVNRTTTGTGEVCDMTLDELKRLRLKTNEGNTTTHTIPTLEEFIQAANGRVYLYLDKAGIDLAEHEQGHLVKVILDILRKQGALDRAIFVLNWPYHTAKQVFGDDLERVVYIPVIEDSIPNVKAYAEEYIQKLSPVAFQFRFRTTNDISFQLLPQILAAGSKAFVAATWEHHTANHGDRTSVFTHPDAGWGWLLQHGFSVIETNCTREFVRYLKTYPGNSRYTPSADKTAP